MRRRLDLAASLVATPPIVFLDEPTTGLDPRSRMQMWEVIDQLMNKGTTILLTTQYLEEADKLADRIAVIDRGAVIAEGSADELKARVGKDRLEVVVPSDQLERAHNALGGEAHMQRDEGTVSTPAAGVGDVRTALTTLEHAGIHIESLSLHKPTLDDVFLKLTGHEAESPTQEHAAH
jgi:ABC-2 type transport system ATP-binding protein